MTKRLDLSVLVEKTHLMGHRCLAIRTLDQLKALYFPGDSTKIEFTTRSQTNPAKVTCHQCYSEFIRSQRVT